MMNWIGFGTKRPWPNFKVLSRHSPGGTEEITETARRGGPRFEPVTPPDYEGVLTTRPRCSV
jgi:hypothetical protein